VEVPGALFRNTVTITNGTGAAISDVKYVRVMDWDVPFTEFSDVVTIIGTATTTALDRSHNDGFETANPLVDGAEITLGTLNADFVDLGTASPLDHGAYFRFNFGSLDPGESVEFSVFYGAAPSELAMLAALGLVPEGIELYSLGQSSSFGAMPGDPTLGTPITYAFAFSGVGGSIVVPPTGAVPEPATVAVWGGMIGLGSILAWRARRQRKNAA
jgi:type IV pilus assembly protein PilY1